MAGLLFLTINGRDGNGEQNPWSVLVVEALRQHDKRVAVVLKSPTEGESMGPGTLVVPLYDVGFGVNRWSPRPSNAGGTPGWAQMLSTGSCVAVGRRCVAFPEVAERAARQIAVMFLREAQNGQRRPPGWYPWGSAPTVQNRRSRRGDGSATIRYRPWGTQQSHLSR